LTKVNAELAVAADNSRLHANRRGKMQIKALVFAAAAPSLRDICYNAVTLKLLTAGHRNDLVSTRAVIFCSKEVMSSHLSLARRTPAALIIVLGLGVISMMSSWATSAHAATYTAYDCLNMPTPTGVSRDYQTSGGATSCQYGGSNIENVGANQSAQNAITPTATNGTDAMQAPLPGALFLFGGGLGLIGFAGWRNKRKTSRLPAHGSGRTLSEV
jgi:hypothetical protein